jgi:hypothetical protein
MTKSSICTCVVVFCDNMVLPGSLKAQRKGKSMRQGGENASWYSGYHIMYTSLYLELRRVKLLTVRSWNANILLDKGKAERVG